MSAARVHRSPIFGRWSSWFKWGRNISHRLRTSLDKTRTQFRERHERMDKWLIPSLLLVLFLNSVMLSAGIGLTLRIGCSIEASLWIAAALFGGLQSADRLMCITSWRATLLCVIAFLPYIDGKLAFIFFRCKSQRGVFGVDGMTEGLAGCRITVSPFDNSTFRIDCCEVPYLIALGFDFGAVVLLMRIVAWILQRCRKPWVRSVRTIMATCSDIDFWLCDQFILLIIKVMLWPFRQGWKYKLNTRQQRRRAIATITKAHALVEDAILPIWQFLPTHELLKFLPYETPRNGSKTWHSAFERALGGRLPLKVGLPYFPRSYACIVKDRSEHICAGFENLFVFEESPLYSVVSHLRLPVSLCMDRLSVDWKQFSIACRMPALSSLILSHSRDEDPKSVRWYLSAVPGKKCAMLCSPEFFESVSPALPELDELKLSGFTSVNEQFCSKMQLMLQSLQSIEMSLACFSRIYFESHRCACILANVKNLSLVEHPIDENVATRRLLQFIARYCCELRKLAIVVDNVSTGLPRTHYFEILNQMRHLQSLHLVLRKPVLRIDDDESNVQATEVTIDAMESIEASTFEKMLRKFVRIRSLDLVLPSHAPQQQKCLSYLKRVCETVAPASLAKASMISNICFGSPKYLLERTDDGLFTTRTIIAKEDVDFADSSTDPILAIIARRTRPSNYMQL